MSREFYEYKQKYDDFTLDIDIGSMSYLELLVHLHYYLFGDSRIRCDNESREKIDFLIRNVMVSDFSDIDELSEALSRCISVIWLYQPFYDGNTRTVILLLKLLTLAKGYEFKYNMSEHAKDDYKQFVSCIYSEKDKVGQKSIQKIKEYLYEV